MQNLDTLIAFIAKHFPFDENAYPELAGKGPEQVKIFALNHLALHFSKTAGKIATVSERVGHGAAVDVDALRQNTTKAFINALRLAELVGLSGEQLIQSVEGTFRNKTE